MAVNIVVPSVGESITEGTIVRWMKKIGDRVDRDEPLFEISTDKVDAEIPSPAAGVLAEGAGWATPAWGTAVVSFPPAEMPMVGPLKGRLVLVCKPD